jgi:hypothetical protein
MPRAALRGRDRLHAAFVDAGWAPDVEISFAVPARGDC